MSPTTSDPETLNGVDLVVLGETVAAITRSPALAATNFRSCSPWDDDRRVITTLVAHASSRRIRLKALEVRVSGAVDLRGILNLADVRPGFEGLQVEIQLEADLSEEELTSFVEQTLPLSPVLDLFLRGAPVATGFQVRGQPRSARRPSAARRTAVGGV